MHKEEHYFHQCIAGEISIDEAFQLIEANSGFPIQTQQGTFIFAFQSPKSGWLLAGDHEDWNGEPMNQVGDLYWLERHIATPVNSRYKFRNHDEWIADPRARRYAYDENGQISFVLASVKHIERWDCWMTDRRIRVWVPDDGIFDRTLYIHDGQNIYDPEAIWGGWRLQDSLPDKILAVAIDNNAERLYNYTHTTDKINDVEIGGDADEYLSRIEKEVLPQVAKMYGETTIKGVMGSSLGGLLAFYTIYRYPQLYKMAMSLSGTMGWGSFALNNKTMIDLFRAVGKRANYLYLDSGGGGSCIDSDGDGILDDGDSWDNYATNIQMRDTLLELGYQMDVDLWHWYEANAPHNEAAWAGRVWRCLSHFANISATADVVDLA